VIVLILKKNNEKIKIIINKSLWDKKYTVMIVAAEVSKK
tara:strand:+ start:271 stop:387 length:117 start_codon:yes stop_codon:yes gene_type:complete